VEVGVLLEGRCWVVVGGRGVSDVGNQDFVQVTMLYCRDYAMQLCLFYPVCI
jgi:hypothetical protein